MLFFLGGKRVIFGCQWKENVDLNLNKLREVLCFLFL